jgi:ribokinase
VHSPDDARTAASVLLARGFRRIIITLGEAGALLATPHSAEIFAPFPVSPVDTTGAGDAFSGSLAAFLGEGLAEKEALCRANLYAALSTLRTGTQKSYASRAEFDREWAKRTRSH